jgi:hypothetical protein
MASHRPLLALLFVAVAGTAGATALAGCSSDEPSPGTDAGGTDAAPDGSPCGPLTLICKPGTPGKACSQVPTTAKCNGTTWECQQGSISASMCGCAADNNRPVGGDCTTPDAGTDDAAASDASTDGPTDGGSGG